MSKEEFLVVRQTPELIYDYAAGRYGSLFLKALRQDGILLASECTHCGITQVPPRVICGQCWQETGGIVPVGPQGRVLSYTMVTFPFLDPFTGVVRPVPYCYGMIQLDGAANAFQHFLAETDITRIHVGLRVEAVFKSDRAGSLADILHFRTLGASESTL